MLSPLSDAVEVVTHHRQRHALVQKLHDVHPVDRPHQEQYDDQLLDVLTEVCAFAWAAQFGELGRPYFCSQLGAPDLRLEPDGWIEAKAIHPSRQDRAMSKRMQEGPVIVSGQVLPAGQGLYDKTWAHFTKATRQLTGRHSPKIVFFNLTALDLAQRADEDMEQAELKSVVGFIQTLICETSEIDIAAFCHGYLWKETRVLNAPRR